MSWLFEHSGPATVPTTTGGAVNHPVSNPSSGLGIASYPIGASMANSIYDPMMKPWSQSRLFEMLAMRLRWGSNTPPVPMTAIHVDDRVFITVVKDGKAQIIEEGDELFPSDTLITQLRLVF